MHSHKKAESIVYVVDDDADVREGLKSLFQSVGWKSEAFSSTADFLKAKRTDEASCLILDVRFPDSNGLDFQIELANVSSIPIVFITAYGDIPMSVRAMKAGAVGFFVKPLREQDLLDVVRAAIERDRARRESETKIADVRKRFETLTPREQQIMKMVCAGLMNKQTAARMGISEITVKVHRHNVMKKLGVRSLPELVRIADLLGSSRP